MPEQRETTFYESGRATAPPGVCYTSLAGPTSEGYTHTVATTPTSTNLTDQTRTAPIQSPLYNPNYTNFVHQRAQSSPRYTPNYSPCPSPSLNYSSTISKTNSSSLPVQSPQYTPNYSTSTHLYSPTFSSSSNFSSCTNSNSNNINNNFEFPSTSKNSPKSQQSSYVAPENTNFPASDHHSSTLFNYPKISKLNSTPTPKYTPNYSNFSYFSNSQTKNTQSKETVDLFSEKNSKSKKDCEVNQKSIKTFKDDTEFNYNIGELQQFLSKHGTKIKNTTETSQDLVTDSLLHFLQKKTQEKNSQDNFSYDLGDISQILVSLTSKYKSEEASGLKKKEGHEDPKLMNDFLTKLLLEKEEKRFKTFDDKKKLNRKEIFDDLDNELDEKKIKRDAMSHYQEDKTHHKRSSNFGDFNQWDYLSQQEIQTSNNHNRRGHFSFGGTSQAHSVGWSPMGMGMGMPRQTNPYYSNPQGHVMPAHAHPEYRYNQWNNPNHKNVPNIHNAHSQNIILPQTKMDIKHHTDLPNSVQDFGLPVGPTTDFSKMRTSPRDMMLRTPPPEKSTRTSVHPDHLASISPAIRNPSALRTPPLPTHPKTIINNPLSDLQMLVTNQENESPPQKPDSYQQESVDLSAHSEMSKQKEILVKEDDKNVNDNNSDRKEFRSPISVIQTQNKQIISGVNEICEKPVELTSKNNNEKSAEIKSSISVNNLENKFPTIGNDINNKTESIQKGHIKDVKIVEEPKKPSVIVEKDEKASVQNSKSDEVIPKNVESDTGGTKEKKIEETEVVKKEETTETAATEKPEKEEEGSNFNEAKKGEVGESTEEDTNIKISNEVAAASKTENESIKALNNRKRKPTDEISECESKKAFLEVESQLEKMFEGVGDETSQLPTVSSTSTEVKPTSNETHKKPPKKKPSRKSRAVRLSSEQSLSSENHFQFKKFKPTGKKVKKSLCDVMDRRGPFLHVEGSKECPSSVVIVNFPKGDDEDEKDKGSAKKQSSISTRTKHHNELDYRGRSKNGLFSSTLSARYDAHTTDHTWVCVFCKKGPHYNTLGDLFGPYIISKDENTSMCDFSGDEKDISDAQKRGGRNKKSLRSNNMVEHFQKMSRKLRRTQSNDSCLTGMTVISDDQVDQLRYEVWVHEQCAVWSPNVCLIGSRIVGMQEAIWSSVKTMCSKCGAFGANIGCVYRNCPNRSHYHCAKESGWSLEQESFISTCHIHKPRS